MSWSETGYSPSLLRNDRGSTRALILGSSILTVAATKPSTTSRTLVHVAATPGRRSRQHVAYCDEAAYSGQRNHRFQVIVVD